MNIRQNAIAKTFAAIFVLGFSCPLAAQESVRSGLRVLSSDELRQGFAKILPRLGDLNWRNYFSAPEFQDREIQALSAASKAASESVARIFDSKVELTPLFRASMTVDYQALSDLEGASHAKSAPSRPLFGRANGAMIDLRVKAEFLGAHQTSQVAVSVRTLKPGTAMEVQGCYVWYAPYYDDREANWDRFGPISSPSTDQLPPGIWVLWAKKGDKTGKRERLNLTSGVTQRSFDIDAPE